MLFFAVSYYSYKDVLTKEEYCSVRTKITVCNKADYYRCRNRKIHMIQLMPHRVLITVIFWYRNEDLPFNGSNTGFLQIGGLQISASECMKNRGVFSYFQELFCISFTVILSKMWNIRVKSMIWRPFPLITRAIQIFHSSLSFVKETASYCLPIALPVYHCDISGSFFFC